MKIRYLSDLHFEFLTNSAEDYADIGKDVSVVIIAGDIDSSECNYQNLKELSRLISPKPLLYVSGNHDYYHSSKPKVNSKLSKLSNEIDNFYFLNRDVLKIKDVVFIGCTGWQSFPEYDDIMYYMMNDFRLIKNHNNDVYLYGQDDLCFLKNKLEKFINEKTVVITHVIPTPNAINWHTPEVNTKYKYIHAYYNEWDDLIKEFSPNVWICGHCHDSFDKKVYNTRIVRNALGYLNYKRWNAEFDKFKYINV
jgi:Icc-related predicted phosphoesterase